MRTAAGSAFAYSADTIDDGTLTGVRRIGKCPNVACFCPVATRTPGVRFIVCPNCGTKITSLASVTGRYTDSVKCDDRCMNAVGKSCTCPCGGKNHGKGHDVEDSDGGPTESQLEIIARRVAAYGIGLDANIALAEDRIDSGINLYAETLSEAERSELDYDAVRGMLNLENIEQWAEKIDCPFGDDMLRNFRDAYAGKLNGRYVAITEGMVRATLKSMVKQLQFDARKAQWDAENAERIANAIEIPTGVRVRFSGRILKAEVENVRTDNLTSSQAYFVSGLTKVVVSILTPEGQIVSGTFPDALRRHESVGRTDDLRGRFVALTATLKEARNGGARMYYSRPSNASFIEESEMIPAAVAKKASTGPRKARKATEVVPETTPVKSEPTSVKSEPTSVKSEPTSVKSEPTSVIVPETTPVPTMLPSSARTYPMMDGTVYGIETPDGESATITRDGIVIAVCPVATALEIISLTRSRIRDTYPEWARTPERFAVVPETPAAETEEPPTVSEPAPVVPETTPVTVHEEPTTESIRSRFAEIITYGLTFSHRP